MDTRGVEPRSLLFGYPIRSVSHLEYLTPITVSSEIIETDRIDFVLTFVLMLDFYLNLRRISSFLQVVYPFHRGPGRFRAFDLLIFSQAFYF